jgi:hypothetical protein
VRDGIYHFSLHMRGEAPIIPMEELPPEPSPPAANPVSSHTTPTMHSPQDPSRTMTHLVTTPPIIPSHLAALPLPIILFEAQRWHQATALQAP